MRRLIVIAGPTGSGKTDLALAIARRAGGEIVNYDSVQVYRGFDIGSAKPDAATRRSVPHHLFDIVEACDEFNAADYGRVARETCEAISERGATPVLVGGTFFYLRALLSGLPEMPGRDEPLRERIRRIASRPRGALWLHRMLRRIDAETAARVAMADRHRVERAIEVWMSSGRPISSWQRASADSPELPSIKLGLRVDRETLNARIERRTRSMFEAGLVDETRALLDRYPATARPFGTIGYKEALGVIEGTLGLDDAIAETARRTRAYAKRQMTWLRSERNVHWLDANDPETLLRSAMEIIEVQA
jgi:tRNA dimethylallyltransferase